MKRSRFSALWVLAAIGTTSGPVWAQTTIPASSESPVSDTQSYTPDYFTQFAPQTASDMVARLPGFEIRGGGGGSRGFGQASLNILINGRRPSSKSSRANDILRRIPATNVTRIDIVDGASLDIPGLSGQVANIIAKTGEFSGNWEYALRFEEGSQPQLGDGTVNFSAKRGLIEAVGSLNFGQFIFTEIGEETFFDGNGEIVQDRTEKIGFNTQRPSLSLNFTTQLANGDVGNLNLSGGRQNRNVSQSETFENNRDPLLSGASFSTDGRDFDEFEISGDYSFDAPLLGRAGRLKLIALHKRDDLKFTSRFLFDDGAPGQTFQEFIRDDISTEYIGRAEYTWATGETSDWALSIEGALNRLNSETSFAENNGTPDLANVRVEEDRIQANLSRSWALNDRTNIQTSVGAEYSVIEEVLGNEGADTFFRPKGLVSLSRTLSDEWTLRGQIERSVNQLNFGTFVSTVNLAEDRATGGSSIVPEQNWEGEIELQRQSSTGLSGRAKLFYNIIEDPIDLILLEDGTQVRTNLDTNANQYGVEANLTWVLDDVLKGLRVTANGLLADSSTEDVITRENRAINNQTFWRYGLDARWDVQGTPYAFELELEQERRGRAFRIDETQRNRFNLPEFEISAIHKDIFGIQWTVKVQNVLDFTLTRDRLIFDGTRNGDLIERQFARRERGRRISLELTDTF